MASTAADIQIGVNLIDDYLSIADAPVADDLLGRFLVVQDLASQETASELLTVGPNGSLAHFYPDTSSHSGWGMEAYAVTPPTNSSGTAIKRLAGFYANGVLQTLCYFDTGETGVEAAAWMYSTAPGIWTPAALNNDAKNALYYTYQADTYTASDGTNYVYGITASMGNPAFFVVMYDASAEQWRVIWAQYLNDFSPQLSTAASFRLAPGPTSDQFTVLWAEAGATAIYYRAASTADGYFAWTGDTQSIDTSSFGAITVERIYPFAGEFGEDNLLLLDTSAALYVVGGFNQQTPSITPLTNANAADGTDPINQPQPVGAVTASAGVDSSGNQRIVAIKSGSTGLWYMTIDPSGQFDPTTAWVNLGGTYETIGCPANMIYGPELFAVDLNNAVYHKALTPQDPTTQANPVWVTAKIAQPVASTATPQNVSLYAMHLQAVDANGNPAGSQVIDVTADHSVTVVVNDVAHAIGPDTPVPVNTDATGNVTVNYQTADLKPPVITFTVSGTSATRWCQGDSVQVKSTDTDPVPPSTQSVSNRLQNNDPTRTVSNNSLTTAQTQAGTCPATGVDKTTPQLMSQSYASTDPNGSACSSLINAGSWMDPNNTHADGTIDASKLTVRHWRIDFAHPDGVKYEILTEDQAKRLFSSAGMLGSSSGAFGDVCEFFKHMVKQLNTFAATVEQDATTGLYELKIAFNDTMTFIISTAKEAGAATETIFSKIADGIEAVANDIYTAVERVIEWLKMLFEWQDIVYTHTVMKNAINSGLTNLKSTFANADTAISNWFNEGQAGIDAALAQVDKTFSSTTSFNDMVNALGPANSTASTSLSTTSGNTLANTQTQNTQQQNAGKANYVSSKSNTHFSGQSTMTAMPGGAALASGDPAGAITQAFVDNIFNNPDYATYLKQLTDFVSDMWSNPQEFFNLVIQALFDAAMDLMNLLMQSFEAVLTAIANLVEDAIGAAYDALNATIDIPILSWLWENVISGSPLTFLDLICLLGAVPATIIYKLIYGAGSAPFSKSDTSMSFTWPSDPFGASQSAETAMPAATEASVTTEQLKALGITSGVLIAVIQSASQGLNDLGQLENIEGDPASSLVQWASRASCISAIFYQVVSGMGIDWSSGQSAYMAAKWAWAFSLFPLTANITFTFFGSKQAETELVDTYGNNMTTCMQLGCLCYGIWAATEAAQDTADFSGWDVASDIISPLPGLFACTMSTAPLAEDTVLGCFAYDLYTLLGAGIVTVGAACADD